MVGPGAFPRYAAKYHDLGLTVHPCGGDDGKKPLISGYMTRRYGPRTIEKWSDKYPDANVGLCPGLNGFTVVDVDEASIVSECIGRFGGTPLVTQTPRGGYHLWYRSSGERSQNLRPHIEGEIKCRKVQIILPPSKHFQTKRRWLFIEGDETDLESQRLPQIRPGSIPEARASHRQPLKAVHEMSDGDGRNYRLFDTVRAIGLRAVTFDELMREADRANQQFKEPLSDNEVVRMVAQVWKYKEEGHLYAPGQEPVVVFRKSDRVRLQANPDALLLHNVLHEKHGARSKRGESFAFSAHAMSKASRGPDSDLPRWSHVRYRNAMAFLHDEGDVIRTAEARFKRSAKYTLKDG